MLALQDSTRYETYGVFGSDLRPDVASVILKSTTVNRRHSSSATTHQYRTSFFIKLLTDIQDAKGHVRNRQSLHNLCDPGAFVIIPLGSLFWNILNIL
ncbi:hypothetical protein CBL_03111 [Carabus blaptoides fortunei]